MDKEICGQCDNEDTFAECVECGLECCEDCLEQNEDGDYVCVYH